MNIPEKPILELLSTIVPIEDIVVKMIKALILEEYKKQYSGKK